MDLGGSFLISALTQVADIEEIVYVINNIVFNLQKPLSIFGIFTLTCFILFQITDNFLASGSARALSTFVQVS